MKRVLLLIIGLGLIIWGILGLNELKRQLSAIPERPGYGIPEKDRENLAKDNTIATVLIVVGGLLFLWGLTPSFKPKHAAKTEAVVTITPLHQLLLLLQIIRVPIQLHNWNDWQN